MSEDTETSPISEDTFRYEVTLAAGDLQTVSNILVAIGHADIEVLPGWLQFFGRSVDAIADRLLNVTRRAA